MKQKSAFALLLSAASAVGPVVLFHGIDDLCPMPEWEEYISLAINDLAPVRCMEIGSGRLTSIFDRIEWQIKTACHHLHNHPFYAGR